MPHEMDLREGPAAARELSLRGPAVPAVPEGGASEGGWGGEGGPSGAGGGPGRGMKAWGGPRAGARSRRALLAAGSEFMSMQPIVVTGRRSSVIHCNHKRTVVQKGDPVFLEFGSAWNRYTAPMMQTVVAGGDPSTEMRRVHDGCRRIVDTLLTLICPGVTFDQAAQNAEKALQPLAGCSH